MQHEDDEDEPLPVEMRGSQKTGIKRERRKLPAEVKKTERFVICLSTKHAEALRADATALGASVGDHIRSLLVGASKAVSLEKQPEKLDVE